MATHIYDLEIFAPMSQNVSLGDKRTPDVNKQKIKNPRVQNLILHGVVATEHKHFFPLKPARKAEKLYYSYTLRAKK